MVANNTVSVILPSIVVAAAALLVALADLVIAQKRLLAWIAAAGVVAGAAVAAAQWAGGDGGAIFGRTRARPGFAGMVAMDKYGLYCILLFAAVGVLTIVVADGYLERRHAARDKSYGLLLLITTGMIGMAVSTVVIAFFVSFEPTPTPTPTPTATPTPTPTPSGRVYYVSTSGNDANAGTVTAPFRTLAKGVSVLGPGDTLYVRGGTYLLTPNRLWVGCSGTASASITIAAYPGETATISGDANQNGICDATDIPGATQGEWAALVRLAGNYLIFKNIEVCFSGGRGIESSGGHNTVYGCDVHHIWTNGILLGGAYNVAQANMVWRAVEVNLDKSGTEWTCALLFGDAHTTAPPGVAPYTKLLDNVVYHNSGEGIGGTHSDYALVKGNIAYDNWACTGVYLDQSAYSTVEGNLIYWTGDRAWSRFSSGVAGIMIASEATDGGTYPITHDEKVLNNIVVGCGTNITFWQGLMPGNALVNDLIAGNTLVEAHGTNLKFEAPYNASHQNTRICNNIILQTSGTSGYTSSTTGLTFDHNLWSKTPSSGCSGTGDVIADPLLVDAHHAIAPGQVAATWYGLTTSSPARGKGIALPDLTLDFFGNARSDPPDIGAHQYKP